MLGAMWMSAHVFVIDCRHSIGTCFCGVCVFVFSHFMKEMNVWAIVWIYICIMCF